MILREATYLADENIHPQVVQYLRDSGISVVTVRETGLAGASDIDILRHSVSCQRVVLTHDSDFGMLAIMAGEPVLGIIYLRPSHIIPEFTISSLKAVFEQVGNPEPPFIIVSERSKQKIMIRIRKLE